MDRDVEINSPIFLMSLDMVEELEELLTNSEYWRSLFKVCN